MDDSLRAMEERLERLVPKGLSDLGRERMEEQIDQLARGVAEVRSGAGWKWGTGAAAAVAVMGVGFWQTGGEDAVVAGRGAVSPAALVERWALEFEGMGGGEESLEDDVLTMAMARQVEGRMDRGWVVAEGAETPHRYWSYEVTDEEELMDAESGYAVRVVSRQEEWIPVEVTSL
jgi:hypothetical protein